MRALLALLACAGCVRASEDTDGHWWSLTEPCIRVGDTRRVLEAKNSVLYAPAGDTILYSAGESVSQVRLATGEERIVVRSDGLSQFGPVGDDLVYYESDGDPLDRRPIDVIVDHGANARVRYDRVSPHPGHLAAGLIAIPAGAYWWTTEGIGGAIEEWRWDPETGEVAPFVMNRSTIARHDDTSFFYANAANDLIVRAQTGDELRVVASLDVMTPPLPIGIDGDALFYGLSDTQQLIARDGAGIERVLAEGYAVTSGAIDATYVYFTANNMLEHLLRVPRDGSLPPERMFEGEPNSVVFDVTVDACNVYWQQLRIDGVSVYGREIAVESEH